MSSADAGREELGAESVHRHNERRWAEMRGAWCSYHRAAAKCDHRQRVEEVPGAIAKGAAEKMWSTYWEVSELAWSCRWDRSGRR